MQMQRENWRCPQPFRSCRLSSYLKCMSCWLFQLYPMDKYGHTLDSVVGKMSVRQGRRPFWTCQEACWRYLLGERASIHEMKDVIGAGSLVLLFDYTLANIATEMSEARQLDDYETSWTWPRLLHTPILECWRGPNKTPVSWLPTWHAGLLVVQMWALSRTARRVANKAEVMKTKTMWEGQNTLVISMISISHSMTSSTTWNWPAIPLGRPALTHVPYLNARHERSTAPCQIWRARHQPWTASFSTARSLAVSAYSWIAFPAPNK